MGAGARDMSSRPGSPRSGPLLISKAAAFLSHVILLVTQPPPVVREAVSSPGVAALWRL